MRKLLILLFGIGFISADAFAESADDAYVAEIKERYAASLGKAKTSCAGIADKIDQIKAVAGIATGVGAIGTVGGGVALTTGIIKNKTDKEIEQLGKEIENMNLTREQMADPQHALYALDKIDEYVKAIEAKNQERDAAKKTSQTLGTVRTVGNFVAGGAGAGIAIASFAGASNFNSLIDEIVADMNNCNTALAEIEREKTELTFVAPTDPMMAQMTGMIERCKGMNASKVDKLKDNYKVAGVMSAVGGAAGIVGGITSAVAGKREKDCTDGQAENCGQSAMASGADGGTKNLNLAANIGAGVAAVGNGVSTAFSIAALAALKDNSAIADKCKGAF